MLNQPLLSTQNDSDHQSPSTRMSRRAFLQTSTQLAAGLLVPGLVSAAGFERQHLSFYHTHTGERLVIDYLPGRYSEAIRREFEVFLRDFRTGDVHAIDPELLDILFRIQRCCGSTGVYEVISGYRSPQTNEFLRRNGSGVEEKSLHLQGQAIDVRLSDRPTRVLRDIALSIHDGGIGYYPQSNFVHLDTGIQRTW